MGKENKMILFESFLSAVFRSSIYIAWLIKNNEDISSMCISITHYLFWKPIFLKDKNQSKQY